MLACVGVFVLLWSRDVVLSCYNEVVLSWYPDLAPSRFHAPIRVLCRKYQRIMASERLSLFRVAWFLARLLLDSLARALALLLFASPTLWFRTVAPMVLLAQVLLKSWSYVIVLSFSHTILTSCWHGIMLVCSHALIPEVSSMLLHFPAPTASCPHAPNHIQSLTCKETLPHCLASRSLIVQVSEIVLPLTKNAYFWKWRIPKIPRSPRPLQELQNERKSLKNVPQNKKNALLTHQNKRKYIS